MEFASHLTKWTKLEKQSKAKPRKIKIVRHKVLSDFFLKKKLSKSYMEYSLRSLLMKTKSQTFSKNKFLPHRKPHKQKTGYQKYNWPIITQAVTRIFE